MLDGTETVDCISPARSPGSDKQGVFPEHPVRRLHRVPLMGWMFNSLYPRPRKVLKVSVKLDTPEVVIFCRVIPISLWVGSLLAVAWGGALCQRRND